MCIYIYMCVCVCVFTCACAFVCMLECVYVGDRCTLEMSYLQSRHVQFWMTYLAHPLQVYTSRQPHIFSVLLFWSLASLPALSLSIPKDLRSSPMVSEQQLFLRFPLFPLSSGIHIITSLALLPLSLQIIACRIYCNFHCLTVFSISSFPIHPLLSVLFYNSA